MALDLERLEAALEKQRGILPPKIQDFPDKVQFDSPILPTRHEFVGEFARTLLALRTLFTFGQNFRAYGIVHRAAIVRINQPQIPKFAALINVRYARAGDLDKRLSQCVEHSEIGDLLLEGFEICEEQVPLVEFGYRGDEILQSFFLFGVLPNPSRMHFRFASGLQYVVAHATREWR